MKISNLFRVPQNWNNTALKFSIKDFFGKCDQIRRILRIWSHLLKKSLMENFIFCAVFVRLLLIFRFKITNNKNKTTIMHKDKNIQYKSNPKDVFRNNLITSEIYLGSCQTSFTAQKNEVSIKDFFSKRDQICRKVRV